ncbi:MAG: hypothetical protein K6G89_01790 [Clostridia bacterium]|nr:hypothetical protein [Clostridia bacterium]
MKRILSLTVAAALAISSLLTVNSFSMGNKPAPANTVRASGYLTGDADGDGEITDWDCIVFERWLAGWKIDIVTEVLDVDGDCEVSDWDAIMLSRYLAGWKVDLDPGHCAEDEFTVAENGASAYKFVVGDAAEYVEENVAFISERLGKNGVAIPVAGQNETPEHSIIVEYPEDIDDPEGGVLSSQGYRIFADAEQNIRINGTSLESFYAALEYFESLFEDGDLSLANNFEYNYHPFNKLDGLRVDGTSIEDFKLVYDDGDGLQSTAAKYILKLLFTERGAFVKNESGAEHTITFVYGQEGSSTGNVSVTEGNIVVTGNPRIGFFRVFRDFLAALEGTELESGASFDVDYGSFISYEDYGAVGDGETDDSQAIYNAHSAQKSDKKTILAREDATYYIGKSARISVISADVDWSTAHFIIDDSELTSAGSNIFQIPAASRSVTVTRSVGSVMSGQQEIEGLSLAAKSLVTLENSKVKQYIRKGANQDSGSSQKEIILVNEDGSIDPTTPVIWDFEEVTSAKAIRVDDAPLTVKGGIFTTIANQASSNYVYYNRGIDIQRSNAVIEGIAHYIIGEGDSGAPYNGFLMISNAYNLTVRDTVLTPHMIYYTMGTGGFTPMGTYDCQVTNTVNLNFERVIQSRSINDIFYWGTFASNYSRNISFDGCILGRFDAHKGVCHVTLKNSTFGWQGINLIGHGVALIENCNIYAKNIINLRDDYGSTWDGDLIIRNCSYYPNLGMAPTDAELIGGTNTFDHDFGYTCYLPKNIVIEGLYVNDSYSLSGNAPMLYANVNELWTTNDYTGEYPMVMTESVTVKDFEAYSGKALLPSVNMFMFGSITIDFE